MSRYHLIRCDRDGCDSEGSFARPDFRDQYSKQDHGNGTTVYFTQEVPKGWLRLDGRDFCGQECRRIAILDEETVAGGSPS